MGFVLLCSIPCGSDDCQAVAKRSSAFQEKPESRLFRSVSRVGAVKTLAPAGAEPVVLLHTKEFNLNPKNPTVRDAPPAPNCFTHNAAINWKSLVMPAHLSI
jgi:hypothetical protein